MAKTLDDVRKSRDERERIKTLLGCIPESILLHDKSDQAIDLLVEEEGRDYTSTFHKPQNEEQRRNAHLFNLSGAGARWGALSRFPQNIGRLLLKLYTKEGDTVVDPFAGHNSRMQLCYQSNRNYIASDLSHEFMVANRKLRDMLIDKNKSDNALTPEKKVTATIELHECDSRKTNENCTCKLTLSQRAARNERLQRLRDDGRDPADPHVFNKIGDFTITSPPYWDLEYYGDEIGQLGRGNEYRVFLQLLGEVIEQNFRALKSGAFSVWCINDFRKDGKFYSYHEHTANLLREVGFKQHDIAITDLGGSFGQAFASQIVENKILPKRHEYALIFRKP
jgi:DNA methylase